MYPIFFFCLYYIYIVYMNKIVNNLHTSNRISPGKKEQSPADSISRSFDTRYLEEAINNLNQLWSNMNTSNIYYSDLKDKAFLLSMDLSTSAFFTSTTYPGQPCSGTSTISISWFVLVMLLSLPPSSNCNWSSRSCNIYFFSFFRKQTTAVKTSNTPTT